LELITKKCPNCGANLEFDSALNIAACLYCSSSVLVGQTPSQSDTFVPYTNNMPPQSDNFAHQHVTQTPPKKRKLSTGLIVLIVCLALVGVVFIGISIFVVSTVDIEEITAAPSVTATVQRSEDADEVFLYNPGDTFIFDNFEITIGDDIEWMEVEAFSLVETEEQEYYVKVPITLTNLSDEVRTFRRAALDVYGPEGTSLRRPFAFSPDGNIERYVTDIRGGATIAGMYVYFYYTGEGYHYITFSTWAEATREVRLYIER